MMANVSSSDQPDNPKDRDLFRLRSYELWWRDQYELLLKHGYELRPRFRPGWIPSWTVQNKKKRPTRCEDGQVNMHPKTIDVKRLSDGRRVMIKRLAKGSRELEVARFLSSEPLMKDPRNHCVPVLDVFSNENDDVEFMVMPLLIKFRIPPFSSVDEVLDFIKQTLEGLTFMHEHGVAHRDCSDLNIMMEGDLLFPKGFHPTMPLIDLSGNFTNPRHRRDVSGIKYYFTDFGISSLFDVSEQNRLVTGGDGQDRTVPELCLEEPYDPFAVDVYVLGNVFMTEFVWEYENLLFLKPLVHKMTEDAPKDRPTSEEALRLFTHLVQNQPSRSLRWYLIEHGATKFARIFWNIRSIAHEAVLSVKTLLHS